MTSYEDAWETGGIVPCIFKLSTRWGWNENYFET